MCGPYWSQWDLADLRDWQGIEDETEDELIPPRYECECGRCMECLGMSNRDFM